MKKISFQILLLSTALFAVGCKKSEEAPSTDQPTTTENAPEKNTPEAEAPVKPATPEVAADYIKVLATHSDPKKQANDPVVVELRDYKFSNVKIADTANLAGASADLEVVIVSLSSGVAKRDGHLLSEEILDSKKFPTAKVSISGIEGAADEGTYKGKLTVDYREKSAAWDVTFRVVKKDENSVTIALKHEFALSQFGIPDVGSISDALKLDAQVTLKK